MQFKVEKKTEVKVNIYGTDYAMRMPNVEERELMLERLDKATTSIELFRLQKDYIANLGLPLEVINDMEDEHFQELAKVFVSPKKN